MIRRGRRGNCTRHSLPLRQANTSRAGRHLRPIHPRLARQHLDRPTNSETGDGDPSAVGPGPLATARAPRCLTLQPAPSASRVGWARTGTGRRASLSAFRPRPIFPPRNRWRFPPDLRSRSVLFLCGNQGPEPRGERALALGRRQQGRWQRDVERCLPLSPSPPRREPVAGPVGYVAAFL